MADSPFSKEHNSSKTPASNQTCVSTQGAPVDRFLSQLEDIRARQSHAWRQRANAPYEMIVSRDSQYSVASISACTVFSVEAALCLLRNPVPTLGMLDKILETGKGYTLDKHLEISTVVEKVQRYSESLTITEVHQMPIQQLYSIIQLLKRAQANGPSAVLLIRPPETIVLSLKDMSTYILFDSHTRPEHQGAAFLIFRSPNELIDYLRRLFPVINTEEGEDAMLLYNVLEATVVRLKRPGVQPPEPDFTALHTFVRLERASEVEREVVALRQERNRLMARVAELEALVRQHEATIVQLRTAAEMPVFPSSTYNNGHNNYSSYGNQGHKCKPARRQRAGRNNRPHNHTPPHEPSRNARPPAKPPSQHTSSASPRGSPAPLDEASIRLIEQLQREDEQFEADRRLAESMALKLFECLVCMTEYPIDDMFEVHECKHRLCRKCAHDHIVVKIGEQRVPMPCPAAKCSTLIHPTLAETVLDQLEIQRMYKVSLDLAVVTDINMVSCPQPNCAGVAQMVPPYCHFICPTCNFQFCAACKVPWHAGLSCPEYQQRKQENAQADVQFNEYVRRNARTCPQCRNAVEKSQGCNHMTCRCGHHFCYACGRSLDPTNPYLHFNRGECPGQLFDVPPE